MIAVNIQLCLLHLYLKKNVVQFIKGASNIWESMGLHIIELALALGCSLLLSVKRRFYCELALCKY